MTNLYLPPYDFPKSWPESLREQVQEALASAKPTALADARNQAETLGKNGLEPFTLGIAATFTDRPLYPALELALMTLGVSPCLVGADMNALEDALLSPKSPLRKSKLDALVLLWRPEELIPSMWEGKQNCAASEEAVARRLENLIAAAADKIQAPVFVPTIPKFRSRSRRHAKSRDADGWDAIRHRLNERICAQVNERPGVFVYDFARTIEAAGRQGYDQRMDLFAKQPIAQGHIGSIALSIRNALAPLLRPARKVLAVDLDNTLWGGILGEDGTEAIGIGRDFPGNVFWRIQEEVVALRRDGVLLVLLSKNEPEDVRRAFSVLPDMPLGLADFTEVFCNWKPKSENLIEASRALGLAVDSFAFVDDSRFEREEMSFALPDVAIINDRDDPLSILEALERATCFDALSISQEDSVRAADYAARAQRQQALVAADSHDAYLRQLGLTARIAPLSEGALARAAQMLGKTNQLNVTTKRHGDLQLRQMMSDGANILLTMELSDKFSDQGIIGLAIALAMGKTVAEGLHLDSFLLSCRALGRGAERALWSELLKRAGALGYGQLTADYLPTDKNGQCRELFDSLGMTLLFREGDGAARYSLKLPARFPAPDWIEIL